MGIAVVFGSSLQASSGPESVSAALLQACVDRWNWMHFRGRFVPEDHISVPAKVKARPCRVEVAYRLQRSDRLYREYLGFFFPCSVNGFGAFVCASHAVGLPGDPPRRGYNARYFRRSGRLRLSNPPARPVATEKPDWVRRYPVDQGFIVPFDRRGQLRAGLTLRGSIGAGCTTFTNIPRPTRLIGCGAGLYCFVPRLPVRDGQRLACPSESGSRLFHSGRLRVVVSP
jgi:hypothetical protein